MAFQNANLQLQNNLYNRQVNDPRNRIINALVEARNESTASELNLGYGPGKLRQVKINYYPVICDAASDCSTSVCDTPRILEPSNELFNLTRCVSSAVFGLNVDDIRQVDADLSFSDHALEQIRSVLGSVRAELADQIAALLVANAGCQPDGSASRLLNFTDPATGAIRPTGLWQIEQAFEDAGMTNPYIVGGDQVFIWQKATQIGGLNQDGQNTGAFNNNNMFYDRLVDKQYVDQTVGHVIAFDPRMVRLVTFSENAGMFATDWDGFESMDRQFRESKNGTIKGSFLDPVTGLIWDLDIRYVDCPTEQWTFQIKLRWDLWFMPDYVCNLDCVTGVFAFETCKPAEITCPTPAVPTPVTPSLFEWTPDLDYPTFIADVTLGGVSTQVNTSVANNTQLVAALNSAFAGRYSFSLVGSDIRYTGYGAISGSANNGTIEIEFQIATT